MPIGLSGVQRTAWERLQAVNRHHHLVTFEPSPVFVDLWEEIHRSKRVLLRAANRVGKTRHCAWVVARAMIQYPGFRVRVVGPTNYHIHNVLGQYLAEFLGPHLAEGSYYVPGKGWNGGRTRVIRLRNGSICDLRSLKDDPDAHSGSSLHMVVFDEPPTLAHFTENAARLVDTLAEGWGVLIVAATMVNRPIQWLRHMVQGEDPDPTDGRTIHHGSGWVQIVAQFSRENCPWYTEEQVAQWLQTMEASPWEWGQRIQAAWDGVTADRIFVGVSEATFSAVEPHGDVKIGIGIDHGEVAGHQAAVLVAYRGTRIWALDEYTNHGSASSPEEDAAGLLRMLTRHRIDPRSVDLVVGDLNTAKGFAGWRINDALELALAHQTHSRNPPFVIQAPDKTPGSVDWGLRCINYSARRGDLHVHTRCHHLAQTLKHWKGGKTGEDGKLSHIGDALRYILTAAIGADRVYAQLRFM